MQASAGFGKLLEASGGPWSSWRLLGWRLLETSEFSGFGGVSKSLTESWRFLVRKRAFLAWQLGRDFGSSSSSPEAPGELPGGTWLDQATQLTHQARELQTFITRLSFDLQRNCYIKNVVLFEENSILLLSECLEASGWQLLKVEVSQESLKNR